jgi:hypothetical protein
MTREDSIRTRTWVTEDGRYLTVDEITGDHLHSIRLMLLNDLSPGYNLAEGRKIASDWIHRAENLLDYTIQIINDELLRRKQ